MVLRHIGAHLFKMGPGNLVCVKPTGQLGLGTLYPTHRLTVVSSDDSTLRLVGPLGANGHGAGLFFGNGEAVGLKEYANDSLEIKAEGSISILTNSVGIGVTAPQSRLHVDGTEILSTGYQGGFKFTNRGTASSEWAWYSLDDIARFWTWGNGDLLGITQAGKVGIGTVNPSHRLTIFSNNDSTLRLIGPGASFGQGSRLNFGDGNWAYIAEPGDDSLVIYGNSATSIMGGYVGIGTRTPIVRLDVSGSLRINSVASNSAVQLPDSSISSEEILNEPGIARAYVSTFDIDPGAVRNITDRYITIPAPGYIVADAVMSLILYSNGSNNIGDVYFSISQSPTTMPSSITVGVGDYVPYRITFPVSVENTFSFSSAGLKAVYLNALANTNTLYTPEVQGVRLTLKYFPTSYGTVSDLVEEGDAINFEKAHLVMNDTRGDGSNPDKKLYEVDLRELEMKAVKLRIQAEEAENRLLEEKLKKIEKNK